ncbi:AraC family transcriptional regulator [Thalassolituus sp. UBA6592]|uniref:AraC family transcriptional regulator n=2 Tax=unclassified Thalassolituus TaxID=2624967 RepID=UPI0025E6026F|nr:AraC family transcriptional regulator [Thalassolituus sp. UBA6592]|tara:strand:+ start:381 stop:1418 length:1038 start_codon:yes stop_codon:yes gene_type:complete
MADHMIARPFIDAPLRGLARMGFSQALLLQQAGLPADCLDNPRATLSAADYARLMDTFWRITNNEMMGLLPRSVRYGSFAMMCKAIIGCTHLEHALHRASNFYRLFDGAPQLHIHHDGQTTRLEIDMDTSLDRDHFLSESLLVIWHRFSSWLVGQGLPLLSVGCAYPAPPHAQYYQDLFATPVRFNDSATCLLIPRQSMSLPVSQTPASLRNFLQHSPADLLARPNPHESTTGKVRQLLRRSPMTALPDLTTCAQQLSISGATLRRRLQDEQTSFQTLKDECRFQEASLQLARQETSIREIAEYLGYTETSTFHRAFRKWMGVTPGEYRQQHRRKQRSMDAHSTH